MWLSVLLAVSIATILWKLFSYFRSGINLDHIPGSTESIIWSIIRSRAPDPVTFHLYAARQAKKYGPVMKMKQLTADPFVFLNDFDGIYQALVKLGKETGGRPLNMFRFHQMFQGTGIIGNNKPDQTWKLLRKITHQHLRHFGDGLSALEMNINFVAENMFQKLEEICGISYDPYNVISDTAMETIIYLTTGQCLPSDHPIVVKMKEFNAKALEFVSPYAPAHILLLDFFPWLRHFGWPGYKILLNLRELEKEVWNILISLTESAVESESITTAFREVEKTHPDSFKASQISDLDVRKSTLMLLFAGGSTTTCAFYGAVNLLTHYKDIQENIYQEIDAVVGNHSVSLVDQPNMPYTRATILEVLRYTSVLPLIIHQSLSDVTIKGYRIPQGTLLMINTWNLHWDPDFWGDPEVFRPERFLDDSGQVVAADHPRRKHLMPFGAGTRVCIGETLAMSRLFLWLSTLVQRFKIKPGEGNTKSKVDPENLHYEGFITCVPYKIILEKRP